MFKGVGRCFRTKSVSIKKRRCRYIERTTRDLTVKAFFLSLKIPRRKHGDGVKRFRKSLNYTRRRHDYSTRFEIRLSLSQRRVACSSRVLIFFGVPARRART